MSKKKNKFRETTIENYYDLKLDKIDELVAALKDEGDGDYSDMSMNIADCTGETPSGDTPKRGRQKQFDPYKVDRLSRIPAWLKAVFIKFWFAGAVCYFVMMGLNISDSLDRIVFAGAVMGVIVDILVNPLFRYMESDKKEYNDFMMFPFPFKAFWTFFANILYYVFILFCVNMCYFGLNQLINAIKNTQDHIYAGVEPLLFGVFTVICDMVFIGLKDGAVRLIKKLRNTKKEGTLNV